MSLKIKEYAKNVATVKKSISLRLCQFKGLSKEQKEIKLVFLNISFNGRKPRKTVIVPEAPISLRDNQKFHTFQLLLHRRLHRCESF